MSIEFVKYGGFTFPYNGSSTNFKSSQRYAKHQYPNLDGADIEALGSEPIEITVEGMFFDTPKEYLIKLYNEYKKGKVTNFSHPLFPDCTKALMTELSFEAKAGSMTLDGEQPTIEYKFTVVADRSSTATTVTSSGSTASTTASTTTVTSYKTHKTKSAHSSITPILKAIRKKSKYGNKLTKAQLKSWNKGIKWSKVAKGTKIKYL